MTSYMIQDEDYNVDSSRYLSTCVDRLSGTNEDTPANAMKPSIYNGDAI